MHAGRCRNLAQPGPPPRLTCPLSQLMRSSRSNNPARESPRFPYQVCSQSWVLCVLPEIACPFLELTSRFYNCEFCGPSWLSLSLPSAFHSNQLVLLPHREELTSPFTESIPRFGSVTFWWVSWTSLTQSTPAVTLTAEYCGLAQPGKQPNPSYMCQCVADRAI